MGRMPIPIPNTSDASLLMRVSKSPVCHFCPLFHEHIINASDREFCMRMPIRILIFPKIHGEISFTAMPKKKKNTTSPAAIHTFPSRAPVTMSIIHFESQTLNSDMPTPKMPEKMENVISQ